MKLRKNYNDVRRQMINQIYQHQNGDLEMTLKM